MECLGFTPHGKGEALRAEGAILIKELSAILPVVHSRIRVAA
jgi:hypothetical protein